MRGIAGRTFGFAIAWLIVAVYGVRHGLIKAALFLTPDSIGEARWRGLSIGIRAIASKVSSPPITP